MRNACLIGAFLILLSGFQIPVEAISKTKIILGSCMMGAGAALSIHAAETSVLDDSGDFEFGAGIALAGVGATFVILGLVQKDKNEMRQKWMPKEKAWETVIGVAPRRGGFSAGMVVRW